MRIVVRLNDNSILHLAECSHIGSVAGNGYLAGGMGIAIVPLNKLVASVCRSGNSNFLAILVSAITSSGTMFARGGESVRIECAVVLSGIGSLAGNGRDGLVPPRESVGMFGVSRAGRRARIRRQGAVLPVFGFEDRTVPVAESAVSCGT